MVRVDRAAAVDIGIALPPKFDFYNRNKRSVALDLKQDAAVQSVLRLVAKADVLIEGFRPGVAERLGLGPEHCLSVNSRLVYGRMTGWGQEGPLAHVAGHDINYVALSGALHCIGVNDRPPVPPLNLVGDLGGGAMYLAVGVLAAVHEAKRSGRGQVVDAAMIDGVSNLLSTFYAFRQHGMWTASRGENIVDGGAHFYSTYMTRDGKAIAVGAIEARFYRELIEGMGLAAESLPDQNDRASWPSMRERFAAVFGTQTRDEWVQIMKGREACFSPVLDLDEAPIHPHMQARKVFQEFGGALHPNPAPRFDRTSCELRLPPPRPGQHSSEVLLEHGFSVSEIRNLIEAGVVHESSDPRQGKASASSSSGGYEV